MKPRWKRIVGLFVLLALILPFLPGNTYASTAIVTTPTGYTQASDVNYIIQNGTVVNWGARGETCVFLTTYAENFYAGSYTYDTLSALSGSSNQSSVPGSDLYKALQALMKSNHTNIQSYQATRPYYQYTDCVSNDSSQISSFYSGKMVNSEWNGQTYNREHTWPNSKGLNGSDENDIMMLRPTITSENSDRGNTAYGESSGYYDPGESVRGDCARIVLYVYVRWGNTGKMWGSSGVIENLNILLKWMEEDPVDTWEMARNDSVQSITGTRNVFIDYPELAFLMFGRDIPANMSTPSGVSENGSNSGSGSTQPSVPCSHANVEVQGYKAPTCTQDGYSGDKYCVDCQAPLGDGSVIPAAGHEDVNGDGLCDRCALVICNHSETEIRGASEASCTAEGYTGDVCCVTCGAVITEGTVIERLEHTEELQGYKEATCTEPGYTGDSVCSVCGEALAEGRDVPPTGTHSYGPWETVREATASENGLQERTCTVCGYKETVELAYSGGNSETTEPSGNEAPSNADLTPIIVTIAAIAGCAVIVTIVIVLKKKK